MIGELRRSITYVYVLRTCHVVQRNGCTVRPAGRNVHNCTVLYIHSTVNYGNFVISISILGRCDRSTVDELLRTGDRRPENNFTTLKTEQSIEEAPTQDSGLRILKSGL